MSAAPKRTRDVYFVGAGLSCALGLPNTAALLDGVLELAASHASWGNTHDLKSRLQAAFNFFYPDGRLSDFRPDVVDFFAALSTYVDIGTGLPGTGLPGAPLLYEQLQFAICHLLIEKLRGVDDALAAGHPYLDELVQPGKVLITSNWDFLLERYALLHDIPYRLAGTNDSECVILKLHGSIDWLQVADRPRRKNGALVYDDSGYASLNERVHPTRRYTKALPEDEQAALRVRAAEHLETAWRVIKSRSERLYMVTMGTGKASRLGPLKGTWEDAYDAISRAKRLEIVGYSMPPDDIEIRTLLRAGVLRGSGSSSGPSIMVRNPSPDVHYRLRNLLDRSIRSEFRPVDGVKK